MHFEDGRMDHELRNAGGLYSLEKNKAAFSPGVSRRNMAPSTP